jgi:hypothetical protein
MYKAISYMTPDYEGYLLNFINSRQPVALF